MSDTTNYICPQCGKPRSGRHHNCEHDDAHQIAKEIFARLSIEGIFESLASDDDRMCEIATEAGKAIIAEHIRPFVRLSTKVKHQYFDGKHRSDCLKCEVQSALEAAKGGGNA